MSPRRIPTRAGPQGGRKGGQAVVRRPRAARQSAGLVANVCVTAATGTAEREAALWLLGEPPAP